MAFMFFSLSLNNGLSSIIKIILLNNPIITAVNSSGKFEDFFFFVSIQENHVGHPLSLGGCCAPEHHHYPPPPRENFFYKRYCTTCILKKELTLAKL